MAESVHALLEFFDRLPNIEKREAITELLIRARLLEFELPLDAELVAAAEDVFLALDRDETVRAGS